MRGRRGAAKKPARDPLAASSPAAVACWEDDPGDPRTQPPAVPISVGVPDPARRPLSFRIAGPRPAAAVYQPGTAQFRYWATAAALRRTANFWGGLVPPTTRWRVGASLPVTLDGGVDLNAFYTRGGFGDTPGLHFFHDSVGGRTYFSSESPDVACHEMGHAVLDALRPQLWNAQSIEAAAFHESFGDMTALLSSLQVASFARAVVDEKQGTLTRSSRLSRLAEQLGAAIRIQHPDAVSPDCLRNAANSFFYRDPQTLPPSAPASQLSSEPHSFSRVFTAAFLDVLAVIFKAQGTPSTTKNLGPATQDAARLLVGGVLEAPVVPDYYSQVAAHMIAVGDRAPFGGKYRGALTSAFVRRGILSLQAAATLASAPRPAPRRTTLVGPAARDSSELPKASIAAAMFGLRRSALMVHTAEEPKRFAVTSSSLMLGPVEPRSPQNAAESFTEDLFQRGRVDVGAYGDPVTTLWHPMNLKTHVIVEDHDQLVLQRRTFDCGFD
jgi:hypothetical protein